MLASKTRRSIPAKKLAAGVTGLLAAVHAGDREATNELFSLAHRNLLSLAREAMRRERPGHTLQPTALVNEFYLGLAQGGGRRWKSLNHFFNAAALAMKRILINRARRRKAAKRGGGRDRVHLDTSSEPAQRTAGHEDYMKCLETLVLARRRFENSAGHGRMSRVLDLHFFGDLTLDETAKELGISRGTVKNDLAYARAWLFREMKRMDRDGS